MPPTRLRIWPFNEFLSREPDIRIEEVKAFHKAYILALEKLQESNTDSLLIQELEWYKMLAKQKEEASSLMNLAKYCGLYE